MIEQRTAEAKLRSKESLLHLAGQAAKVGGWVLDLFGRVPRKAERAETPQVVVTVEKMERTRIVEVLIALRKPAPSQAAA